MLIIDDNTIANVLFAHIKMNERNAYILTLLIINCRVYRIRIEFLFLGSTIVF